MMKKLFVYGVGRSGTSLLLSMIDSHPDICMVPETHFFLKYVANISRRKRISNQPLTQFYRQLQSDSHFGRIEFSPEEILSSFEKSWESATTVDVYKTILSKYKDVYGANIVGVKDPRIIDRLEELYSHFPQAYVIHIVRDPRDVVLSRTKAEWSSHRSYITHALTYSTQQKSGTQTGKRLFNEKYHELNYEDLISYPNKTLSKLCSHINVNYDDRMLDFSDSANRLIGKEEAKWKSKAFGPLRSDNKGKWKEELPENKIMVIEYICKDVFTEQGYKRMYDPDNRKENLLEIVFYWISRSFHLVYSRLKRLYNAY